MVSDALRAAADFKQMEADTMRQLSPVGVVMGWEIIADTRERLAVARSSVLAYLLAARAEASEEERRELDAALNTVKRPQGL